MTSIKSLIKFLQFYILIGFTVTNIFAQDTTKQSIYAGQTELQTVITDYLKLKNALTKDNADTAKAAANTLNVDLKKVPAEIFSADKADPAKADLSKHYDELVNHASNIGSTADIGKQREQFKNLSSNLYQMLKVLKINTIDLFYQHCPMEDAYWISEKSKIVNPYYGKKMPTCGSTKETLKAGK